MAEAATYSAVEGLRDGRRVAIRALRPEDRADLLAAVGRTSRESLYHRFFYLKRGFTEQETASFLNIDFVDHVALVAVAEEAGRPVIVGGARYIVLRPGKAEVAFTVIDQYQGHGIGAALMRHLAGMARGAGLRELIADVLPENDAMLKVFAKSGFPLRAERESNVVRVALRLDATPLHPPSPPPGP
jgi:GNAT superfamily N-acetyltransferase